jgi:shikimate 5-dehydrogenase
MLLEAKTAIIYGGGGAIGSAVARAFAREGARVFLAGRTMNTLDDVARTIRGTGGMAEVARVDAVDPATVAAHAAAWPTPPAESTSPSTPPRTRMSRASHCSTCRMRTSCARSTRL